jgi:hypothetical protein
MPISKNLVATLRSINAKLGTGWRAAGRALHGITDRWVAVDYPLSRATKPQLAAAEPQPQRCRVERLIFD